MSVDPTLREIPPLCVSKALSAAEIKDFLVRKANAQSGIKLVADATFAAKLGKALAELMTKAYLDQIPTTPSDPYTRYKSSAPQVSACDADPTTLRRLSDFALPRPRR